MKSIVLCLSFLLLAGCAQQDHHRVGDLVVSVPWSRETPPTASVAAGFVTIQNKGGRDDQLLRVESATAKRVEIHEMRHDNGVMRMREVAGGLPLPKNQEIVLQPGSYHIMLMGLKAPLKEGDKFPLTLRFKNAKSKTITVETKTPAQSSMPMHNMPH